MAELLERGLDTMKRYYIAYGSNLNIRQMKWRCPTAKAVGTAFLENHTLYFRGSKTGSYLTIEPKIGGKVPVAIWSVTEADERDLDRYEGYPTFYFKESFRLDVDLTDRDKRVTLDCFAYIMRDGRPIGIPSDSYLSVCFEGYHDFGFDKRILKRTVERMERILWNRMK